MTIARPALLLLLFAGGLAAATPRVVYELAGPARGAGFGASIAALGDVDGDGAPDLAVASPHELRDRRVATGTVRVFSGRDGRALHLLRNVDLSCTCHFGISVDGVGDQDGDGVDDVLVASGANEIVGCPGSLFTFSGRTGALLRRLRADSFGARIPKGASPVRRAGDVDADGVEDALVAGFVPKVGWRVWALSGATGRALLSLPEDDTPASSRFGAAVARAGDVDGDGHGDVAVGDVGDVRSDRPGRAGRVTIFSGRDGLPLRHHTGYRAGDDFGAALASAGDLDGDGVDELVVGAMQMFNGRPGYYRIYSGEGARLEASAGAMHADGHTLGLAVAAAGDVDGDGVGDVLVSKGAAGCSPIGSVLVISGADQSVLAEICGPTDWCGFGGAAAGIGDVDGDGRGEVAVSGTGPIADLSGRVVVFSVEP